MTHDTPDTNDESSTDTVTRRALIAATGAAAVGAAGFATGHAAAQSTPSGTFPVSGEDPLLRIRADRIRYIPRSSDPSSPAGGTTWVVE